MAEVVNGNRADQMICRFGPMHFQTGVIVSDIADKKIELNKGLICSVTVAQSCGC